MQQVVVPMILALLLTCAPAAGDDTDIYGVTNSDVPPNVLIIFDNSGSMDTRDVPGDAYDPDVTYSGDDYEAPAVYYRKCTRFLFWDICSWDNLFHDDVGDLGCAGVKNDLLTKGYAVGNIRSSSPWSCGGASDEKNLRTGNYLNYVESGGGDDQRRIDVAKSVVNDLIDRTENVNFGLMVFNPGSNPAGGHIVKEIGADKQELQDAIDDLTASTNTPLAETLAEAGLYFAGKNSWFNGGTSYTSPIEARCQKNHILLMTDGEPTQDRDAKLVSGTYINGDTIGDHDGDGADPGNYSLNGSDYLDDVAHYLYTKDVRPDDAGDDSTHGLQNITTYTIGFQTDQQLLMDTAANGGGQYYTASNYSTLTEAFESIMASISQESGVFVAPVVPVNRMNRAYAGDKVYLGFFKPAQSGRWFGNIKSYYLDDDGSILGADDNPATDEDGLILPGARSRWSSGMDGPEVTEGGVGEKLAGRVAPRTLYTYNGPPTALTHAKNSFAQDNDDISPTLSASVFLEVEGTTKDWPLGDFIHSEPAIVPYYNDLNGNGQIEDNEVTSYIFAGANDGMLHCFSDEDGSEEWGFVPPGQIERLPLLLNSDHDYFVDGSPAVYDGETKKILMIGERRGGDTYYSLDITNPTAPAWLYSIGPDLLVGEDGDEDGSADGASATLGYSWSRPQVHVMKDGAGPNSKEEVFLLGGGYDTNQDLSTPAASDTVGRAIFTVEVETGSVGPLNVNAGNFSAMTHSIVDVAGIDPDGDGLTNRVYAGDLGGHIFALEDDDLDGEWESRVLLDLPAQIVVDEETVKLGQKFMYPPEATAELYGEYLFIGSGDRAHPLDTDFTDALYAIRNDWAEDESGNPVSVAFSDLVDVTGNLIQVGTVDEQAAARLALAESKGWYIRLTHAGEKVVSSPIVFAGTVLFTTYTPSDGSIGDDVCAGPASRGTARLYAIDYLTGGAAMDFTEDGQKTTEDRSIVIGTAIPSAPVIVVTRGEPRVLVGVEGGLQTLDTGAKTTLQFYYWRQLFN